MNNAAEWTEKLKKELGEERYNRILKEVEQQHEADRRELFLRSSRRKVDVLCFPKSTSSNPPYGEGHTCGDQPDRWCEACREAFVNPKGW